MWFIVWGGYSYNLQGPFASFEEVVKFRNEQDIRTDRSRIFDATEQKIDSLASVAVR